MQPTRTQVPPRASSLSTMATFMPSCAARMAATYPPGPAPMMTMSCLEAAIDLHLEQDACGVRDCVLDAFEERAGLASVDEAVVVRQRQVHHRPDDDLTVERDGSLLDSVHPQDAGLRRVDDGRGHQRSEHATVA